jgi:predicted cupin superfamily sugar epimerase
VGLVLARMKRERATPRVPAEASRECRPPRPRTLRRVPPDRELAADDVIALLGLAPHPEGGWYAETWREPAPAGDRPASSAICFLLRAGEASRPHRIDATEVWHWYAGSPLALTVDGEPRMLGPHLDAGERPQAVVPAGAWQSARSLGPWTLVGCTVAPAFEFAGFELRPDDEV